MQIVFNTWFDKFILLTIFANCVVLAIEDPSLKEPDPIIEVFDMVFLIIFSFEMVLKIIAMGFFYEAHSYLRDPWNIVSFFRSLSHLIIVMLFEIARFLSRNLGMVFPLRQVSQRLSHQSYPNSAAPAHFEFAAGYAWTRVDSAKLATLDAQHFVPLPFHLADFRDDRSLALQGNLHHSLCL